MGFHTPLGLKVSCTNKVYNKL